MTNLLDAHQERQHEALALYALGVSKLCGQLLHRLLIEGSLLAAELAKRFDVGLVRQVRDHCLVGLQSTQNVRSHEFAQRAVRIVGSGPQSV